LKRAGFSLAEILLSLSSLAVILVMAVGVLHFSLGTNRRDEHTLRATYLAQEKLVELQDAPAERLESKGAFPSPWQGYSFTTTRRSLPEKGMLLVEVSVQGPAGARALLRLQRRECPRELVVVVGSSRLARVGEEGGARVLLPGTGGRDTQPTVSPDGQTVVFVSDQGGLALWTMPVDGSAPPVRLEGVPPRACEPAFAPDGRQLVFTASDDQGRPQLFVCDTSGKGLRQLTDFETGAGSGCWSPDGSLAAVVDSHRIVTVSGETLVESDGWNAEPAFSPDGRWLAFMSNRDGNPEIYRLELSSGRVERLTEDPAYDTHPRWSADGRRLAFQSERGGGARIWTMNPDGTDLRLLSRPEEKAATRETEPVFAVKREGEQ